MSDSIVFEAVPLHGPALSLFAMDCKLGSESPQLPSPMREAGKFQPFSSPFAGLRLPPKGDLREDRCPPPQECVEDRNRSFFFYPVEEIVQKTRCFSAARPYRSSNRRGQNPPDRFREKPGSPGDPSGWNPSFDLGVFFVLIKNRSQIGERPISPDAFFLSPTFLLTFISKGQKMGFRGVDPDAPMIFWGDRTEVIAEPTLFPRRERSGMVFPMPPPQHQIEPEGRFPLKRLLLGERRLIASGIRVRSGGKN